MLCKIYLAKIVLLMDIKKRWMNNYAGEIIFPLEIRGKAIS
jgi:hypothetical protein